MNPFNLPAPYRSPIKPSKAVSCSVGEQKFLGGGTKSSSTCTEVSMSEHPTHPSLSNCNLTSPFDQIGLHRRHRRHLVPWRPQQRPLPNHLKPSAPTTRFSPTGLSFLSGASPQLRNMATTGGNLMQPHPLLLLHGTPPSPPAISAPRAAAELLSRASIASTPSSAQASECIATQSLRA